MSYSLLRRTRQSTSGTNRDVEILKAEIQRLRDLLAQNASDNATQTGYLFKYRPQATSSLWANTWENRYFIIQGHFLAYYKSEMDVGFPPRGKIDLQHTFVVAEGIKRRKYYTFHIEDKYGAVLIRMSSERQSDEGAWIEALENAGCIFRGEEDGLRQSSRGRSPSPSPSGGSPATSAISETRASSPDRGEVDSLMTTRTLMNRKNSGYTSDQSDVGGRVGQRGTKGKGHVGCALVHIGSKNSVISFERFTITNNRGLLNLVFIILAAANFRLILENILKYGWLFNPLTFVKAALISTLSGNVWLVLCWPAMAISCLCALLIEKLAAKLLLPQQTESPSAKVSKQRQTSSSSRQHQQAQQGRMSGNHRRTLSRRKAYESFIFFLNFININLELFLPCAVIYYTEADPLPSFAVTMVCIILWMKLISFAHVQYDIRQARLTPARYRPGGRGSRPRLEGVEQRYNYPENLHIWNLGYFLVAPTLCYQLTYPKTQRFRLRWTLYRVLLLCFSLGVMLLIIEQYIEPTIDNSLKPLQELDWLRMSERVLKLSIPTLYFWLAMFFSLFHLWLNIVAEFTFFGDREFYKEWWNAQTVGEYWRLWNMPVHKWMLRHVYYPCINLGVSKFAAGFIVFFISAVFHELLVGVPLHMLRLWAFAGILMQVPLMWLTENLKQRFKNDTIGNVIFWVSFCFLGQPLAEIMYLHDYRKQSQAL